LQLGVSAFAAVNVVLALVWLGIAMLILRRYKAKSSMALAAA
jgi:hypothetical protein